MDADRRHRSNPDNTPAYPRLTLKSTPLVLLGLSLAVGFALRLWLALKDDGIYWPDEVYQSLEPAHRLVHGYGLIPWEFIEGARNWSLPGLVAVLLKAGGWLHLDEPREYVPWVKAVFAAMGSLTAWAVYRLARGAGASRWHSSLAASVFSLSAPFIYFAPRAMSETASALPLTFGLVLVAHKGRGQWALGAILLGFAVMLRLQTAIVCIGALGVLAQHSNWRRFWQVGGVLALCAFGYGLADKITWGEWFHSAATYLRFNLVEGKGSQWGTEPFGYYLTTLWTAFPLVGWLLLSLCLVALGRAPALVLTVVGFIAVHSIIPHKEFRFLVPIMPVLCAAAAIGLGVLESWAVKASWVVASALLMAAATSAIRFHSLTFGDLGQYLQSKPQASAYDDFGSVNRLLFRAHDIPDLCGLKFEVVHLAWTGGATYLHRRVPLYNYNGPPRESGLFNYVITLPGAVPPASVLAADGPFILAKVSDRCRPDPSYNWRLP